MIYDENMKDGVAPALEHIVDIIGSTMGDIHSFGVGVVEIIQGTYHFRI
jgi:hypothetical protein